MAEQHKLHGKMSVFVRWRHGLRLNIQPNPRIEIKKLLVKLQKNDDHKAVFRDAIKDLNDGSGWGIHPDSTWIKAVSEIFERHERYDPIRPEVKQSIMICLKAVVKGNSIEDDWDSIRKAILDNTDALSGWEKNIKYRMSFQKDIKRESDGNYYYFENGQKIQIIGAKTLEEEHFQYISDDTLADYGHIKKLLKLISLIDIAEQYVIHPEHFTERVVCVMHDNDHETGYLSWNWYTLSGLDFVPAFWKPRSCFSDPEWLAYDILASFQQRTKALSEYHPRVDETNETIVQQFKSAFKDYQMQHEVALETSLFLGDETEVYFDFEDRKIRWINGTRFVNPMIIIPCNQLDGSDGDAIGKRFLSMLVKEVDNISIAEAWSTTHGVSFHPLIRQPRTTGGLGIDPTYLLKRISKGHTYYYCTRKRKDYTLSPSPYTEHAV